jgi:predicted DCC family thiol-disulfide oxidoreductase YuxK
MKQIQNSLMNKIPHLVFYDDACPMCSKEINHYRRLEACHPITWVPIHKDYQTLNSFGFSKNTLLERLHVVRGDGVIVTGASAFATIWYSIKRYHLLGKLVYKLKLIPVLEIFYTQFAKWRYKRQLCEI